MCSIGGASPDDELERGPGLDGLLPGNDGAWPLDGDRTLEGLMLPLCRSLGTPAEGGRLGTCG